MTALAAALLVAAADPTITLKDVTYAELDAAVAAHKGKVVLVDVWATFCGPCVKKFPHLVELHKRYAADGLVIISLTTNSAEEREEALAFLKEKGAGFQNFRINDTDANEKKWEEKYAVVPQPMLHVFNRKGEKAASDPGKLKPEEVEGLVKKLLAER